MTDDDLFAYLSNKEELSAKARWISTYTLSETELDTLDAETLWAYIGFAQSTLFFNRKFDEFEAQYVRLLSKLAATENSHPFLSQAIKMDLTKYHTAIAN